MPSEPVDAPTPPPRARALRPLAVIAAAAAVLPALWLFNRLVATAPDLGPVNQRLRACPDSPNCVGTESSDASHSADPIPWRGTDSEAVARIKSVLAGMSGSRLVAEQDAYLRYEFRTRICRFIDDVEFRIDAGAGLIQVRSASRLGYSDLGTNRRRVEAIRKAFGGQGDDAGAGSGVGVGVGPGTGAGARTETGAGRQ